ncbi:MAG: methyltransferase [Actinomycetia bacterium]|nr:methyltransferase [Actinomycetes bacterium]
MAERQVDFGGLRIAYDDDVLEPRPWTLEQSRWAVELLADAPPGPVLELCAGAGQIGLVVGRATGRDLVQVDIEEDACGFARGNAVAAGVTTDVRCGELGEVLAADERFPFVLADPPYVPADEVDELPEDPDDAVDGGEDGLDIARECLRVASAHLGAGGLVLIQLGGPEQASQLGEEAGSYGLTPVETRTHAADRALLLVRA